MVKIGRVKTLLFKASLTHILHINLDISFKP